ncbi:hypothetical protein MVES1_001715 [Malassezia vespertilionis]|uniref:Major facilitator superfamily (MFS) profile domain-containing protein n=1 Tax=Malassezia vespertilionis TaxID=2020962 RepID=A0A2N1JCT7_9BASI|nr:uncharacterized protein MVES1_001715 [Malassezia vespertilionis]PKI84356.1 hypothetical protein MVES_001614 [Malassezia vespertilionis]WFD06370.1 hypothetical protein MVES1_001715 [Malassezia vespertilionis]
MNARSLLDGAQRSAPGTPVENSECSTEASADDALLQGAQVPCEPVSFKRRQQGMGSVRRWISHAAQHTSRAGSFSFPLWRRATATTMPDDWEHPARYFSASHVTAPPMLAGDGNPLPMLPYTVLCLFIFGEFCSAGVAGPFLFFMLQDFHIDDEGRVGFWAGIVTSAFFLAQFLTSLLWTSAAEKRGRRNVLQISLVGSTVSLLLYGVAPNLTCAIFFRLCQGFFYGAVGVAKGAVRDLVDETNESRAYVQMGLCWGMGGIVGPILGGLLEHPAEKYPWLFGQSALLTQYPYLLPCTAAVSCTALAAILSLFLDPEARGTIRVPDSDAPGTPSSVDEDPFLPGVELRPTRGTAYGHTRGVRHASVPVVQHSQHAAPARHSYMASRPDEAQHRVSNMSLMERFVLANDDAVLSITDLWVAAATNADEQEEHGSVVEYDSDHEPYTDTPPLLGQAYWEPQSRPVSANTYVPPAHFARTHRVRTPSSQHVREDAPPPQGVPAAPASVWACLPVVVIAEYGLLSFHSATFDQIFLAFLVTPADSGGLALTAGHYAILISAMAFCQLFFQFKVYPNVGPPNGRLSYLAMLQLGLSLHFPCYVLFPFLRTFVMPSTDVLVMMGMIACATLRWLANVFSFTSITFLLNVWSPAHLAPLANGLAQTVSAGARCVGPIVGGVLWAQSIRGGPDAQPWPFNFHMAFWVVGLVACAAWISARYMREPSM